MSVDLVVAVGAASVRLATPLLLPALGEIFSQRAGVINIGLEGMMVVGALFGVLGTYYTQSPWGGILAAMLCGVLMALIQAYVSITLHADQVVTGVALNIFAMGLTSFLLRTLFGITSRPVTVTGFQPVPLPLLGGIPVLGPILFRQTVLVYLAFLLVPVAYFVLYRTTFGLDTRATGEDPWVAEAEGVNVALIRYIGVIVAGGMAGLGGAFLSLAQLNLFFDNMTAGRGFVVLAVVILGRWNPLGALGAALFFGGVQALSLQLQAVGGKIPYQFLLAIPYILTIIGLVGIVGRATPPASLGRVYSKEEEV